MYVYLGRKDISIVCETLETCPMQYEKLAICKWYKLFGDRFPLFCINICEHIYSYQTRYLRTYVVGKQCLIQLQQVNLIRDCKFYIR